MHRHLQTRSTSLDWTEVVECPHCHVRSTARATAGGHGVGSHGHWASREDREDAKVAAGTDAFHSAMGKAKAAIRRARCPRCGKRGESGAQVFAIHTVLAAGAMAVASALAWAALGRQAAPSRLVTWFVSLSMGQVALLCAALGAGVAVVTATRALARADATVTFGEPAAPPPSKAHRE